MRRLLPLSIMLVAVMAFAATAIDLSAQSAPDLGLHLALEARASYPHEDSRSRTLLGGSLYDASALVRPMASIESGAHRLNAELEIVSSIGDTAGATFATSVFSPLRDDELFDVSTVFSSGARHRHRARFDRFAWTWRPSRSGVLS